MASLDHLVSHNLQCPICFELLNDPKQLSCTHSFCPKCLSDLLSFSSQSVADVLTCPVCQTTTAAVGGSVANLNTNVPLKCLVEDYRNRKGLCEMCDKKARATLYCCDCGKDMCKACLKIHNKWSPNLKHEVVKVEDIRENRVVLKKKVYCQEHKSDGQEQVCTDVCTTCKKFICIRCRMLYHEKKGHSVLNAEEYNNSIRREIEYLVDQGKTKATTIKDHVTYIESQLSRAIDHIDVTQAQINKAYDELSRRLKERKAALDWQLYVQKKELRQKLEEMKDASERVVVNIESASELAGYSLKAPLGRHIIAIRDSLSGELKHVLDKDDPEKKLASDIAKSAEEITFIPQSQCDELEIGEIRIVKCQLKCDVDLANESSMNAMAATPDGMMAVGYSTGGIDIFADDSQLQKTVLKDVKALGVGFLSDGRFVVLTTSNSIVLYTSEWEMLDARFETLGLDEGGIADLTIDGHDQIYVSYRTAKKIQEFAPAGGKAIREIQCDGYEP
ncbi:E3 ubiquitin-protein ligase TRIM33 [Strongylocentrotus purpuratus]|uniref:Uncharacterized protein n=1 Tax=Strongylocentrotus purpuratus TaxID=7668 RepID=A0A7M7PBD9_STRPU|nr:E3 ubiquitin-protein ligase TRIM33 [Strongylocentrotus purpuratus]